MQHLSLTEAVQQSVLCWLATVDSDGNPNVSPKEVFTLFGERTLLIAHIASPTSVHNIAVQPSVCVSMINVFTQKGVKLRGRAHLLTEDQPDYPAHLAALAPLAGDFKIRAIIAVDIDREEPIIAPSYWLKPETTEQSQRESAYRLYRVRVDVPGPQTD